MLKIQTKIDKICWIKDQKSFKEAVRMAFHKFSLNIEANKNAIRLYHPSGKLRFNFDQNRPFIFKLFLLNRLFVCTNIICRCRFDHNLSSKHLTNNLLLLR